MSNRNQRISNNPGNGGYYDRTQAQNIPQGTPNYPRPGFISNNPSRFPTQAAQSPRQSYYGNNSPMEGGGSNARQFQPAMPASGGMNTNSPHQHQQFQSHQMQHYSQPPRQPLNIYGKYFPSQAGGGSVGGGSYPTTQPAPHAPYLVQTAPVHPYVQPSNIQGGGRYAAPTAHPNQQHQQHFYAGPPQFVQPLGHPYFPTEQVRQQAPVLQIPQNHPQPAPQTTSIPKKPAKAPSVKVVIRDPNTKEDVTFNLLEEAKQSSQANSQPSATGPTVNNNNNKADSSGAVVAAMFATQVAQVAKTTSTLSTAPSQSAPEEASIEKSSEQSTPALSVATVATNSDSIVPAVLYNSESASYVVETTEESSVEPASVVAEEAVAAPEEPAPIAAEPVAAPVETTEEAVDIQPAAVVESTTDEATEEITTPPTTNESTTSNEEASSQEREEVTVESQSEDVVQTSEPASAAAGDKLTEKASEVEPVTAQVEDKKVPQAAAEEVAAPPAAEETPAEATSVNKKDVVETAVQEVVAADEPTEEVATTATNQTEDAVPENEIEDELEEGEIVDSDDDDMKKVYSRTILMSLRNHPLSLVKPSGLELNIPAEIVVNHNHRSLNNSSHHSNNGMYGRDSVDFTPQFALPRDRDHQRHHNRHQRPSRHQHHHQHQNYNPPKMTFRRPEAELQKAKNAWKPSKKTPKDLMDEEAAKEELIRNVRSILNKLTPQKFTPLMNQIKELPINNEGRLRAVIELVFEKAIDEPNFSEAYANMCRTMSQHTVNTKSEKTEDGAAGKQDLEFRKLLLTRCQQEFEKDHANEEEIQKLKTKLEELDENTSAEERAQAKENLQVRITKQRRRMLGNIRFIGELYKLSMLTEKIMHSCIRTLLAKNHEEAFESLCKLLTTIGNQLDSKRTNLKPDQQRIYQENQRMMNVYFESLQKVIDEKTTCSRVRFMIQDVIDLRKRKWELRSVQAAGPKTIEEIHADHKNEKEQAAARAAAVLATHSNTPKMRGNQGGRHGSRNNNHQGEDPSGWQKVPQKSTSRYDPKRMTNITKSQQFNPQSSQFDENNITFAPRGGMRNWGGNNRTKSSSSHGSDRTKTGSGGYSSSQRSEQSSNQGPTARASTPTMNNRFSALNNLPNHDQQSSRVAAPGNRSGSRDGGYRSNRIEAGGPTASMPNSISSKKEAVETTRRLTAVNTTKSDSVPPPTTNLPPKPSVAAEKPPAPKMKPEDLKLRHEGIIKEYLHLNSIEEALECYAELNQFAEGPLFVYTTLMYVLEKSVNACMKMPELFCKLISSNVLTVDQFTKGAKQLAEASVDYDLECDIPKLWPAFATMLAPVIAATDMTLAHLNEIAQATVMEGEDYRLKMAVPVLVELKKILGKEELVTQWNKHVDWTNFTDDMGEVKRLIEKHELTELEPGKSTTVSPLVGYVKKMLVTIKPRSESLNSDQAFDQVEAEFGAEVIKSNDFTRAVAIAYVWRSLYPVAANDKQPMDDSYLLERLSPPTSMSNSADQWAIDDSWFKKNFIIVQKFVDDEEKELQVLYAVQHFYFRLGSPSTLLKMIFDYLYDTEIVSERGFYRWENSTDENETEGKGVAINSARSFFTWLKDGDDFVPES